MNVINNMGADILCKEMSYKYVLPLSTKTIKFRIVTSWPGLEKNLDSSLSVGQVAFKFCLPWARRSRLFK